MTEEDAVINLRINSLKRVYFFFAFVSIILFVIVLSFGLSGDVDINKAMKALFGIVIYFSIYYGLKYKKRWTPPLILIFSAFCVISSLISQHYPVADFYENIMLVIGTLVQFALALFYAYQIYFFSRKKTREFFGDNGKILFS